jgi:hypothetical protein
VTAHAIGDSVSAYNALFVRYSMNATATQIYEFLRTRVAFMEIPFNDQDDSINWYSGVRAGKNWFFSLHEFCVFYPDYAPISFG